MNIWNWLYWNYNGFNCLFSNQVNSSYYYFFINQSDNAWMARDYFGPVERWTRENCIEKGAIVISTKNGCQPLSFKVELWRHFAKTIGLRVSLCVCVYVCIWFYIQLLFIFIYHMAYILFPSTCQWSVEELLLSYFFLPLLARINKKMSWIQETPFDYHKCNSLHLSEFSNSLSLSLSLSLPLSLTYTHTHTLSRKMN